MRTLLTSYAELEKENVLPFFKHSLCRDVSMFWYGEDVQKSLSTRLKDNPMATSGQEAPLFMLPRGI